MLTGKQLMACFAALERFREEEIGSDIAYYTVHVRETSDTFEVVFVPDQVPPKNPGGPLEVTLGGKTAHGREVHYIVSKDQNQIQRTFFAR